MIKQNFTTTITVDNSSEEVFNAINTVAAWWQGEIEGSAGSVNDEFAYRMKDIHYSKQKVVELVPGKKVVWLVTDSALTFTKQQDEWTGTKIVFDITTDNGKTTLHFTHDGLVPSFECYGGCSNGWEMLIQKSLHSLITSGAGVEVF